MTTITYTDNSNDDGNVKVALLVERVMTNSVIHACCLTLSLVTAF